MKRLILLALLTVLGFYVGWPAVSAYQLNQGLKSKDVAAVGGKIDFDQLRGSLRPAVEREVERTVDEALKKSGTIGASLAPQLKSQFMPKIVEHALATLVTPEILIRLYAEGGNLKDGITRIVKEQAGKLGGVPGPAGLGGLGDVLSGALGGGGAGGGAAGGLGGLGALADRLGGRSGSPVRTVPNEPAAQPAAAAAKEPAAAGFGISNIKRFGFDGPFGLALGVAKDPAATEPDVTAHMAFTGSDWKLVGLVPKAR